MQQHTKLATLVATIVAGGFFAQPASAQFSSSSRTGNTSGNAFTQSSNGGSNATGAGSSALGGANRAGGNAAAAGANNRTAGNGQGDLGQSLLNQNQNQNTNGFLGGNQNAQGNFVGRNQRTGQNTRQQNNQGGNRQQGGRQNLDDLLNGMNQQNNPTIDQRRAIRPQLRVAFDETTTTPATESRSTLQPRFESLTQTPSLRGVAYELDAEGVVVLRGKVDTPSQRRLAENVVKLEPGVKKVRNELTLNDPSAKK